MISALATVTAPCGREWIVTPDGQIMRQTSGSVVAIVEDREGLARAWERDMTQKTTPHIISYDRDRLPTAMQCKGIADQLFNAFTHETMCLYGIGKPGTEWAGRMIFFVPPQRVAPANVHMKQGGMDEFVKVARVLGDMHSHPWQGSPSMSGTDDADMKKFAGLHAIFSNDYHITWYGSVHGLVAEVSRWNVSNVTAEEIVVLTPSGEPIADMMEPMWGSGHNDGRGSVSVWRNGRWEREEYRGGTYYDEYTGRGGQWVNGVYRRGTGYQHDRQYDPLWRRDDETVEWKPEMATWTDADWEAFLDVEFPVKQGGKYRNKAEREAAKKARKALRDQLKAGKSKKVSQQEKEQAVRSANDKLADEVHVMWSRGLVSGLGRFFESLPSTAKDKYGLPMDERYMICMVDMVFDIEKPIMEGNNPIVFVCERQHLHHSIMKDLERIANENRMILRLWAGPLGDMKTLLCDKMMYGHTNPSEGGCRKLIFPKEEPGTGEAASAPLAPSALPKLGDDTGPIGLNDEPDDIMFMG